MTPRNRYKPRIFRDESGAYGGANVFYRGHDGSVNLDVRLDKDTIWLSQKQMADLFATERNVITTHLCIISQTGALNKQAVSAVCAHTATDGMTYQVQHYNRDAIISAGYRVNSTRGTHFCIWATKVLRQHIVGNYSANARRLRELCRSLQLAAYVLAHSGLSTSPAREVLRVITGSERAWDILVDYDHQRLPILVPPAQPVAAVSYDELRALIDHMRTIYGASSLCGVTRDNILKSSLNAILQTFDEQGLYRTCEKKAAYLVYCVLTAHPFVDRNTRSAATLFVHFVEKNHPLYRFASSTRSADATLVAVTLTTAERRPEHKDLVARGVAHLLHTVS